jgi:aminoglycoside 6'-N-acetyltransferase I
MLVALEDLDAEAREHLAALTLEAGREHSPGWLPDLEAAREEIREALVPGKAARVLVEHDRPIAWVAAAHDWGRIWELHPLIVAVDRQRRGHGSALVREIEAIARAAGALTMTLGTSDMTGATSLSGVDLYDDLSARLAAVELRAPHALGFWRRAGYTIVGVIPDAEAPGQPSITLARRL